MMGANSEPVGSILAFQWVPKVNSKYIYTSRGVFFLYIPSFSLKRDKILKRPILGSYLITFKGGFYDN